jgi:hypothetical protein
VRHKQTTIYQTGLSNQSNNPSNSARHLNGVPCIPLANVIDDSYIAEIRKEADIPTYGKTERAFVLKARARMQIKYLFQGTIFIKTNTPIKI